MPAAVKSIHNCFKWIYFLLRHTGCIGLRIRNDTMQICSRRERVYVYAMRAIFVFGFLGTAIYKLTSETQTRRAMYDQQSPVLKFILVFECGCCVTTYLEMAVKFDMQRDAHLRMAQRMQSLDESMLREFPYLRWNYHKLQRKFTSLIVTVVLFYFSLALIYVFNMSVCGCHLFTTFVVAMSYACITTATGCSGALLIAQMDYLRLRYRLIDRLTRQFLTRYHARDGFDMEAQVRIGRLVDYCKQYTELIRQMNNVLGFIVVVGLFYDFGILTNMTFLLCHRASDSSGTTQQYIVIVFFMMPRIYKVLMTAIYGYLVNKEKDKCLHTIAMHSDHFEQTAQLRENQRQFFYWKMNNNFHLTMGQVTPLSLNIAYMVLHGVINYVIILIQLQFQQINISNRFNNQGMAKDVEIIKNVNFKKN